MTCLALPLGCCPKGIRGTQAEVGHFAFFEMSHSYKNVPEALGLTVDFTTTPMPPLNSKLVFHQSFVVPVHRKGWHTRGD